MHCIKRNQYGPSTIIGTTVCQRTKSYFCGISIKRKKTKKPKTTTTKQPIISSLTVRRPNAMLVLTNTLFTQMLQKITRDKKTDRVGHVNDWFDQRCKHITDIIH